MSNAKTAESIARRIAFDRYMRTRESLRPEALDILRADYERKFNPNHDPTNGRFTFGSGGLAKRHPPAPRMSGNGDPSKRAYFYQGRTKGGLGAITPMSGGDVDPNGRIRVEQFPPDPYALHSAAHALDHYADGSGQPRNYYMNNVDLSSMPATFFPDIDRLLRSGTAGTFEIAGSAKALNTVADLTAAHLTTAGTLGNLTLVANGKLTIRRNGVYDFRGRVGAKDDVYDFDMHGDRTPLGQFSTWVGRRIKGTKYPIYIVGTQPFNRTGRTAK